MSRLDLFARQMAAPLRAAALTLCLALGAAALATDAAAADSSVPKENPENNEATTTSAESSSQPAASPSSPDLRDEVQDLIYYSGKRPLFLRMRIRVGSESFSAPLKSYVRELFDTLDANKDQVLDEIEAKQIPPRRLLVAAATDGTIVDATSAEGEASPPDGKVTPDELFAYVRSCVGKPFDVVAQQSDSREDLDLFNQLDENGDCTLSVGELESLQPILRRLDLDDNGILSRYELVGQMEYVERVTSQSGPSTNSAISNLDSTLQPLGGADDSSKIVVRLLQRYDKLEKRPGTTRFVRDKKLSADELGLNADQIKLFDKNGDGVLDAEELFRLVADPPPTAELAVYFGKRRTDDAELRLISASDPASDTALGLVGESQDELTLVLNGERMRVDGTQGPAPISARLASSRASVERFSSADRDNNDYLDENEFRQVGLPTNLFAVIDQDGNQQIYQKELKLYLDLQDGLARSRIHMTFRHEGAHLYQLLDENGDTRISEGELRRAFAKIQSWDKNGDSNIELDELPSDYKVLFSVGPAPDVQNRNAPIRNTMMAGNRPQPTTSGPIWFQKMDRNRDGQVSRREFLGPLDVLQKLDSSGDGLLDPSEAEQAK